ncbi:PAS domain S-box protein [Paenibacillus ginsengarvi]|nr:PAS domain S-box protein [Paenibacillus ginsengarvi]
MFKEYSLYSIDKLFHLAFEQAPIAMALFGTDSKLYHVNGSFCEIVGFSSEQLSGQPLGLIVHPDDAPAMERLIAALLRGRGGESCESESRFVHSGGHTVWAKLRLCLIRDEQAGSLFFIAQVTDITKSKEAQQELELGRLRYQSLLDHHPDLIFSLDLDGYVVLANEAFQEAFGVKPADFKTRPLHFKTLTAPDYLADTEYRFQEALKGTPQRYEAVGIDAGGNRIVFDVTNIPIVMDGQVVGVHGMSRNVTKQKELWHKQQESEHKYRLISENCLDIIACCSADGLCEYVSPSLERILDYNPAQWLGKPVHAWIHPHDMEGIGQVGPFLSRDTHTFEFRALHRSGSYVWIESAVRIIRSETGQPYKILSVWRDISDRKRTEKKLRAAKERLESFMYHNVDPIVMFDTETRVLQVNEAYERTFGWKEKEIAGLHLYDYRFVPEEQLPEVERNLIKLRAGVSIPSYETVRMHKDGTRLNIILTAFPLWDESGNIAGCSIMLRDNTERKQAEEHMMNREKLSIAGQLAAGIAHEIRNPITAIKGFIQLMNSGVKEKKLYFDIISSEVERIESILSELLLLAKPQNAVFSRHDIALLLEQVVTLLDSQAIMSNVMIVTDFDPCSVVVSCDENQLKQVWINFIKNAIEAMPGGGKVAVKLRKPDNGRIVICITDEGCGIPQTLLDKLGQPFYTTKEKGTGLGFMVSRRIIENHKGTLEVRSQVGLGTTIEVNLPVEPSLGSGHL